MIWGPSEIIPVESKKFTCRFDCDEVGEVREYVGCKVEQNKNDGSIKFTQPVLLQSYKDEFELSDKKPLTPAEAGNVLMKADKKDAVGKKQHTYFRSGVGKLLHEYFSIVKMF